MGGTPASVVAPVAEKRKVPMLAFTSDPGPVQNFKYVFRAINSYSEYSEKLLEYLRSKGWRNFAVIQAEDPYFDNMINGMKRKLKSEESLKVVSRLQYTDNDFRSVIAKIKAMNIDALGVFLMPGQQSTFFNQAEAQKLNIQAFGPDVFESTSEIMAANGNMEGSVYVLNRASESFRTRYIKRFGNDNQIAYAANAYECAKLIVKLFGASGSFPVSSSEIINRFKNLSRIKAESTGDYNIATLENGDMYFQFPIVIKEVCRDGTVVVMN